MIWNFIFKIICIKIFIFVKKGKYNYLKDIINKIYKKDKEIIIKLFLVAILLAMNGMKMVDK